MLLNVFSRWLMGLLNKTGPNANWCFYSCPFCRVICFMAQVSFHYFSVAFGDPFSPLLCSKLPKSTLIQLRDVNHAGGERRLFIVIPTHYPSCVSFTWTALETRFAIRIRWEKERASPHPAGFSRCSCFRKESPCHMKENYLRSSVYGPSFQGSHMENPRS